MPHKLLLADDSVTIQRVIELTFADEDVHVLAVGDGKKAIESIQSDRPDIVLADVGMPERDGYEVAEFIKRNPQLANIPVLLLTGAFEPIDETRARAVGCDGVLVKPFEPQMVINRVKDLLAGRRSGGLWGGKPAGAAPEHVPSPAEKPANSQPTTSTGPASPSLEEYFDRLDAAFASVEAATEARSPVPARPSPPPAVSDPSAVSSPSRLSTDDFPGWDPDLAGDSHRSAATGSPAFQSTSIEPPAAARPVEARPSVPASVPSEVKEAPAVTLPTSGPVEKSGSSAASLSAPAVPTPGAMAQPSAVPFPSLAEAFAALLSAEQGRHLSPSNVASSPAVSPSVSEESIDEIVRRVIARMSDTAVRETVLDVAERLVREEIERIKGAH